MTAQSKRGEAARAKRAQCVEARRQARIEDVEFLLQFEGNAQAVVKRAGFTNTESAQRYLDRVGRHDLARRIRALAEPCDPWEGSHISAMERRWAA
ncbi:hypothetical protein [Kocuria oceani]|uniref:Uncharacterized protein n=1 Tax=Kocuria oceani TaxID=988827 RepID=A0ABV9TK77_9MICC|nr:hypothetical protein [Kocuria oceani]